MHDGLGFIQQSERVTGNKTNRSNCKGLNNNSLSAKGVAIGVTVFTEQADDLTFKEFVLSACSDCLPCR